MKRLTLLLSFMALTSPVLAQEAESTLRVQSTMEAATPGETLPGMSPSQGSEAQTTSPQAPSGTEPSVTAPPTSAPSPAPESRDARPGNKAADPSSAGNMPRTCASLRAEIDQKIHDNGVSQFTLDVVPAAEAQGAVTANAAPQGAEIVGSCDAGRYKVLYRKGG